ncbi:CDP-alcohol phosphatidyltransferase family protein [Gordonia rubripertincta]|uniref:CDP-alcohol phosphatidyltransferase family protein n=1 Tax=Gordonia rubripertincta TaxID=36822 RepID=A0AAW6REU8_GORRU|nr:CDP-alcohol phosphatidyltransferase family protein [Gordonia rubripertincta]ASR05271.1 CDP-diacylglycerol--inositol 3-phosphatidyltransferase [Gordonia rubripertincta]MDG6782226.1 CDP-alcohol phosphatidyltransferase family protein [Gordonia rubripertincta]
MTVSAEPDRRVGGSTRPGRRVDERHRARRLHRDAVLDAWSELHGGIDPRASFWVERWVLLSSACARPLVRLGVTPNVITVCGAAGTAIAFAVSFAGGGWYAVAALVILLAAVLDGVDGAIAAQTGTATQWGRVLDTMADRWSDIFLAGIVVMAGAPPWLGVVIAVLTLFLEGTRATAQAAGMNGPGTVTVWERPSRVILAFVAMIVATVMWAIGVSDGTAGVLTAIIAGTGAILAMIGLLQLFVAVFRQTRGRHA